MEQLKAGLERKPNRFGSSKEREFSQELPLFEQSARPLFYQAYKTDDPKEDAQVLIKLDKNVLERLKEECIQYLVMELVPRYEGLGDQSQKKGAFLM